MGFVNGAAQGVFPGATASLVPDASRLGSWVGMIFSLCGFATLAGPPVMGAIVDASNGSYVWAQIWAGLVIILGAACTLLTARMMGRRRAAKGEGSDVQRGFFLKA
jgi:MFS transporter, MCT family, solute carrier family 16 (monocarboxylic acid transporters), member 3